MAFHKIVDRFCTDQMEQTKLPSVNIIGATPLDFSLNGSIDSIRTWLTKQGWSVNSCFAMGSSLEEIKQASKAHVNLVISYGGIAAARLMEERFGIPYVVGVPFGKDYADYLAGLLDRTAKNGQSLYAAKKAGKGKIKRLCLIGESVFATSLATAIEMEYDLDIQVLTPLDTITEILREGDRYTPEEDDLIEQLKYADGVIADPLYRALCGQMDFYDLPHEAFSGRIYDDQYGGTIMLKLAIYGKGGIGKSTTTGNLAAAFASLGKKVIQIGCDPKADSTINLLGGNPVRPVMNYLREFDEEPEEIEQIAKEGFGGVLCIETGRRQDLAVRDAGSLRHSAC